MANILNFGQAGGAVGIGALILVFCAYFLALEAVFLSVMGRAAARNQVNKRLWTDVTPAGQFQNLVKVRRGRALAPNGDYILRSNRLNRLVLQSGTSWGMTGFAALFAGGSIAIFLATHFVLSSGLFPATIGGVLGGAGLLYFNLMRQRAARQRKLEAQLPEAIDILVRSLKAGHPILAAIRLVRRELPDPIGSEFGILADEITYGLDLESAMNNLAARVGQEDLTLVVVAAGIQASAGGNLAEILGGMSHVVRERLKMRLKVKAMSAEGRFSAMMLSVLPFALFGILWLVAPSFYGEIWDQPIVKPVLSAAAGWLMIGNFVMHKMVRFRI
ncbi:MAG TPA: type II secretion system F family protein [Hyphomicrobiaceae bacterium]|jgi:tight adherence protein B